MRKHIATCCISLNLSEDQVTDLANFMGHDKNIHKSHYRQPIPELEIICITQFLEAAQGGVDEKNEQENEEEENLNNNDSGDDDNKSNDNESNYSNKSDIENEESNTDNISSNSSFNTKKQRRNVKAEFPEKDVSAINNKKRRCSKYISSNI